ncbi:peptidoglycan-binding protein [Actibacterium sp.]|uniref:peptidoglycan-binding domain-containing protein n=1 Tax=Actibacterium sp. TaxID=1872125 RepID=UPI0035645EB2
MPLKRLALIGLSLGLLAGCQAVNDAGLTRASFEAGPPGAPDGTCWAKIESPAVIETVTEHIMLQPAEITADGQVLTPALYKTETQQRIVKEREITWFETPCNAALEPEFVASLQRALAARGYYKGAATGVLDNATRRAVRKYQAEQGLDSPVLSLAAAQQLGLVAYPRPPSAG